jgi:hypothetical protein
MYLMSFFRILKGVREKLDHYRSRFFWQSDRHKKKYRLAKWSILNKPRYVGGLGILDLDVQNICLLSKWLCKHLNENGVWQSMVKKKCLQNKTLSQVNKRKGDSHFWKGLMDVEDYLLGRGRSRSIVDIRQVSGVIYGLEMNP